ncbi:hypothetical protein MTP99_007523 [Tenebrio molitor]|nr:hypothetical protein MTP99_007523 [Tenebrio molitor]
MRRTKLYTLEETRLILKTRKEFEYKINGVSKNLQDFKEYILYEKVLLKQIHNRRDKNMIAERKSGIEYKILRRIKNLYEIALQRFSNDFSLCLSYFKFCKQSNYINAASVAVQNMIKNCSQNPEVWQVAAAWYANDRNDLNTALKVLNKGLTIHKNSQVLYTEAIKLELSAITKFVWHTLAQRERRGLHYGASCEEIQRSGETCLSLCFTKYQEGLKKVSSSEKANLWLMYLDCLVETQRENNELPNSVKSDLLKTALEQASSEKYLTEKYYIKWLELVTDEEALNLLEKGTSALPHSIDLWKLHLRYATMTDKNLKVDEVFKRGVDMLKERSLPLWFMYLRYYGLLARDDIIDSIYRKGITQPQEISETLKPKYIEWLALSKGINDARKMYNILANEKPYCKELHATMSKLESTEIDHDYEIWAQIHELACKQFGEEDVDVWINHILFYLHFNKSDNVNEKVQRICREAENTLSPLLQSDFREKYAKALSDQ